MEDSGKKLDDGKNRLDLIPPAAIIELGKVLTMGSGKYGDRNWEKGIEFNRVYGAALRHLITWWNGEDTDKESGLSHLSHCLCNIAFLIHFERGNSYGEFDNRP